MRRFLSVRSLSIFSLALAVGGVANAAVSITPTLLSKTTSGIFGSSSSQAFPTTPELSNLTTLGPTDWATWTIDGTGVITKNRQKSGGVGIGALTSNRITGSTTGTARSQFDFTDGTPPDTTANDFVTGAGKFRQSQSSGFILPTLQFDAPLQADGSNNQLKVWFSGTKLGQIRVDYLDAGTSVGTSFIAPSDSGDVVNKFIYNFEYGGADSARPLTFRFSLLNGNQDDSQIVIHGAALDAPAPSGVPEPASLALLGLGGMALLRRRRD